jgi:hypothetical protein
VSVCVRLDEVVGSEGREGNGMGKERIGWNIEEHNQISTISCISHNL